MSTTTPTLSQIQQAIAIAERIERLEEELGSLVGADAWSTGNGRTASEPGTPPPVKRGLGRPRKDASPVAVQPANRGRKPFSAETKAKMAAAQRARWAAQRTGVTSPLDTLGVPPKTTKPAKKAKRHFSPEVRARLAAAMKARWAAAKKKGVPGPAGMK